MSEHNEKRTDRLFDAIGMIDDSLIQDAMSPAKARGHIARRKRMRISLASAACICCIIAAVLLKMPDIDPPANTDSRDSAPTETHSSLTSPDETHPHANDGTQAPEEVPHSLEQVLAQHQASPNVLRLSAAEIDLHDSTAKLIWKVENEEHYNVVQISKVSTLSVITTQLDRPLADLSAEASEQVSIKTWIAYGDGRVDSPYLKHTPGNTGYGVLFDYCAEVEPSSKLTDIILDLIQ